ncbi:hypothetical protein ANN_19531 [Periplaneta americana]|uniref:Histone-lysine N-methyltransferase SETMAR n=1 Tax=Periplaneta americana TaxID=6978 RepID=A0ABQ8SAC8_PERAM|nr:hypothetical protein ANN_19531 [Periplaneta americana]
MAGLCEGGNELPGSLKASVNPALLTVGENLEKKKPNQVINPSRNRTYARATSVSASKHLSWLSYGGVQCLEFYTVHARIASYLHAHATTQKDSRRAKKELERNRRTTLLLTGIAVLFAVSWLPLADGASLVRQFSEGRQSVHDEERNGRPSLINDDRVELVRQCIMENRRFTITKLSSHFPQISRSLLHEIVTQRNFLSTCCSKKKGILLIDFLPRGEKVNADRYCETLRKLRRAIQNKRRGMLTAGVVLLHDNARPHTARRTAAVLTEFGWELFDHPPYSPDLAPSDFHVFLHLKKFLSSGERFGNDEELKTSVTRWFHSQAAEFYDRGIQKLIPRYDKCLNSDGGYVEK